MIYAVVYHPQLHQQIIDIVDWYENKSAGLGGTFIEDLDKTIQLISSSPFGFEKKKKQSRQVKLVRFPYILVYELHQDTIEIYAVIHAKRHPSIRTKKK